MTKNPTPYLLSILLIPLLFLAVLVAGFNAAKLVAVGLIEVLIGAVS